MKHRKSIVTEAWARQMLAIMPTDRWPRTTILRVLDRDLRVTLRRCSYSDGTVSGGLIVKSSFDPQFSHGTPFDYRYDRRLGKGWTDERFKGVVRGLYFWTHTTARLALARERLHHMIDALEPPQIGRLLLSKDRPEGCSEAFTEMTLEDLAFWNQALRRVLRS